MHALRVQHVADAAGVSQPLVSQHFRSRDELIGAAFVLYDQLAFDAIVTEMGRAGSGRERLDVYLDQSLQEGSEVRRSWTLWQQAWAYSSFSPELNRLIKVRHAIWQDQCRDLIREGQQDGSLPAGVDPEGAAASLMAMLDGLGVSLRYELIEGNSVRRLMAEFAAEALAGRISAG